MLPSISIKLADPRCEPKRANPSDAGADLVSVAKHIVYPNTYEMVDTGVAIKIPEGCVGLVYSRSGMGKVRVSLTNSVGVIDAGYRGNIKVMVLNEGDEPYEINAFSTRIAQLVIAPVLLIGFSEYGGTDEDWLDTSRGTNGFGSTN